MRLDELAPVMMRHQACQNCRSLGPGETCSGKVVETDYLPSADMVKFVCPIHKDHFVILWRAGVSKFLAPDPQRWLFEGSSLADVTLSPVNPPMSGCLLLFRVVNGWVHTASEQCHCYDNTR